MESIDGVTGVDVTTGLGPEREVKIPSPDNSLGVKVVLGAVEAARVVVGVACVVVEMILIEVPLPVIVNDISCVCVEAPVSPSGEGLELELSMVVEERSGVPLLDCDEVEDIDGEGISGGTLGFGWNRPPEDVVVALLVAGVDDMETALEVRVGLLTRDEDAVEILGADVVVEPFRETISRTNAGRLVPRGSDGRRTMPGVSRLVHDMNEMNERHVLTD